MKTERKIEHETRIVIDELHGTEALLRALLDVTLENNHLLRMLVGDLHGPKRWPKTLTLTLASRGKPMNTGQTVIATVTEADAAGVNFPIDPSKISFSVSTPDQAVILFTDNGDGTATVTAVAPGTATLNASDSQFKLTGSVQVTVTDPPPPADTPATLTITLGEPTNPQS
jgi:hypothetical protein